MIPARVSPFARGAQTPVATRWMTGMVNEVFVTDNVLHASRANVPSSHTTRTRDAAPSVVLRGPPAVTRESVRSSAGSSASLWKVVRFSADRTASRSSMYTGSPRLNGAARMIRCHPADVNLSNLKRDDATVCKQLCWHLCTRLSMSQEMPPRCPKV
eukprot:Polyplicarium_translucidae@DN3282_c0_g2_i5.p2